MSPDQQRLRLASRLIGPLMHRVLALSPELAQLMPDDAVLFQSDILSGLKELMVETFPDELAWQAEAVTGIEVEALADLMASLLNSHRLAVHSLR